MGIANNGSQKSLSIYLVVYLTSERDALMIHAFQPSDICKGGFSIEILMPQVRPILSLK
jgi:hypothetical protein